MPGGFQLLAEARSEQKPARNSSPMDPSKTGNQQAFSQI
jgi:hypothetical protein